jgi:hypothetical protein
MIRTRRDPVEEAAERYLAESDGQAIGLVIALLLLAYFVYQQGC